MSKAAQSSTVVLYDEEYRPPFLPLLVMVPIFLPMFWKYHVRVVSTSDTTNELSFGYSHFFKTQNIPSSEIQSMEIVDHVNGLFEWGGYGYRKNLYWETGYITKNGPAIRVTVGDKQKKNHTYVFNCDHPKLVYDLFNQNNNTAKLEEEDGNDLSAPLLPKLT